ncbi:MAG: flagellar biosynthesis anti-sigma factor FlgM [Halothiobacillus sp. 14-56-357]|jgi:negative regulator of flagellin synthesis FlgM|nr:MAG: flagellar biosynthesis anti-sigma factor FlgM [Halothiobacillus sp. 14-56-357]
MSIINGFGGKNGYGNPAVDNKNTGKPTAASGEGVAPESTSEDTGVNLSSGATAMKQLTQTLASSPSFDQSKVDQIKSMIANGQYSIDPQKIAQKFMEMENSGS